MATIKAFRALRFDPAAGPLRNLVCPLEEPADDDALRRLYAGSPNNIAHLLFPREGRDPYEQARNLMCRWLEGGILRRDDIPGLYVWEQRAQHDGAAHRMLQLVGMVRLGSDGVDAFCEPPEPAFDPFPLLCATRANLDAVQALLPDPESALLSRLQAAAGAPPLFSFDDRAGTSHRIWRVDDPAELDLLTGLVDEAPLTLTYGKHRYDAALRYRDLLRHRESSAGSADWALMALAPAAPENLLFLPAQLVLTPDCLDVDRFLEDCGVHCSIERVLVGELGGAVLGASSRGETAVGLMMQDAAYLLALRDFAVMEELLPGADPARTLPYHMLRALILERIIGMEEIPSMRFLHSPAKAIAAVEEGEASMAFLLGPIDPQEALALAESGEKTAPQAAALYPPMIAGHLMAQL